MIDGIGGRSRPTLPCLRTRLANAARDRDPGAATETPAEVGGAPDTAEKISGKTFQFADNRLNVKSFTLNLFDPDSSWEITTEKDHSLQPFSGLIGLDGLFAKAPGILRNRCHEGTLDRPAQF